MLSFKPAPNTINPNPHTFPLSKHDLLDHLAPMLDKKILDGIGYSQITFDDDNNIIVTTTPEHPSLPSTTYKVIVRKMRTRG